MKQFISHKIKRKSCNRDHLFLYETTKCLIENNTQTECEKERMKQESEVNAMEAK